MPERINAGHVLVVLGGAALFVSLFLSWYEPSFPGEPGVSAWTAFELLDIVLAGVALLAIAAVLPLPGEPGAATAVVARWLPWLGLAALVLVVVTLLNDPPGAHDRGLEVGAWIGLAGALALAAGAVLSVARVSLVIGERSVDGRDTGGSGG